MDKEFNIRSKTYILPRRAYYFKIVLNICLVFLAVTGLIGFVLSGFNFMVFGGMILPFVIVAAYKRRPENQERYEFCLINLHIKDKLLEIIYMNIDRQDGKGMRNETIIIPYNAITTMEYSDQLTCLRICREAASTNNRNLQKGTKQIEHLLYLEKDFEQAVLRELQAASEKSIRYMDR